jgi:hypothetical protein
MPSIVAEGGIEKPKAYGSSLSVAASLESDAEARTSSLARIDSTEIQSSWLGLMPCSAMDPLRGPCESARAATGTPTTAATAATARRFRLVRRICLMASPPL